MDVIFFQFRRVFTFSYPRLKQQISLILTLALITFFLLQMLAHIKNGWWMSASSDLHSQYYPFLAFLKSSLRAGSLPLWTPFQATGHPFYSEMGLGILYPVNWVVFLMDTRDAVIVIQLIHIMIGMVGMILYLRYLEIIWPAAIAGACIFGASGMLESFQLGAGATYSLIPYVFLSLHRMQESPSPKNWLFLTASLTLAVLGGFIQYFFYMSILLSVYLLGLMISKYSSLRASGALLRSMLFGSALVAMLGLICVQFLPSVELSLSSVRDISGSCRWESPFLLRVLPFEIEAFLGHPQLKMESRYFGSALFLIPFALLSKENRRTAMALFAALAYGVIFIFSKEQPALAFLGKIPLSDAFRIPTRMGAICFFPMAALAGTALSAVSEHAPFRFRNCETGRLQFMPLIVFLYATGMTIWSLSLLPNFLRVYWKMTFLVLIPFLFLLFLSFFSRMSNSIRKGLVTAVIVFSVVDLALHPYFPHLSNTPSMQEYERNQTFLKESGEWIKTNAGYNRVLVNSPTFRLPFCRNYLNESNEDVSIAWDRDFNMGDFFRYFSINSYTSMTLARWNNYMMNMTDPVWFDRNYRSWPFYGSITTKMRELFLQDGFLAGSVSVKYFITHLSPSSTTFLRNQQAWELIHTGGSNPLYYVYENKYSLPRAYLATDYVVTHTEADSLRMIKVNMGKLHELVVLEGAPPSFSPNQTHSGSVSISRYRQNEVELILETSQPSLLVLTDTYYPGWTAEVNGSHADIWRANSLYRAVEVPKGTSIVVFRYRPFSLYVGLGISCFTIFTIILVLWFTSRREGKRILPIRVPVLDLEKDANGKSVAGASAPKITSHAD